jgi:YidC/Oxa1 family membrane protein insertase
MDTRRLILVLIFTFSSFMLWESWQKYNQPKPPADAVAAKQRRYVCSATPTPTTNLQAARFSSGCANCHGYAVPRHADSLVP